MRFHILTLFPEMVLGGLKTSILGRACEKGMISLDAVNIRDYTADKHKKVDDYPYGGGAGMLMQAQPVYDAWRAAVKKCGGRPRVIYVTPQGSVFHQEMARELAKEEELIFLCGHYEGIDERVLDEIVTDYVSIGDYVLTGGELPAMVMIDAISRMVPGVLKNDKSGELESFHENLLEYPQYTRPEVWNDKRVPEILLSGDHAGVEKWRKERSIEKTVRYRPDLYQKYDMAGRALEYLKKTKVLHMDMIENIRRGQAEMIAVREDGVLLKDAASGIYMVTAQNKDAGERLLSETAKPAEEYVCHRKFLAESIEARFHKHTISECLQAVYTRKQPFAETEDICIRRLDDSFTDVVTENYHLFHDREYIRSRLRAGMMYGAFRKGALAGFIGVHAEGSMGMLEVFEDYRRMGIGTALEKYLINRQLEKGYTPYSQVIADNEISLALQQKLGMKVGREKIYWIS